VCQPSPAQQAPGRIGQRRRLYQRCGLGRRARERVTGLRARWFVPIEKVIGENQAWCCARCCSPTSPASRRTGTAVGALAVCVAVIATVMASRDVTA